MAAHSADVPAAGTARGSGWGRGARSSETPRSPRGERGPLRPPIAWQEASLAGAARLAGRPASENKCENVCEVACEAAREVACAIAPENACAARRHARMLATSYATSRAKSRDIARDLASRPAREIASRPAREIARGNGAIPRRDSRGIPARLTYPPRLSFVSHLPTVHSPCTNVFLLRRLEPEAASAGARQEMGKNQRCSHRTCGHRTFPITATEAPSAQVRLGELCGHRQRWWPLRPLRP